MIALVRPAALRPLALLACLVAALPAYAQEDTPAGEGTAPTVFDWSLGLRGAYVQDEAGDHFEGEVLPHFNWSRETVRGGYGLAGDAEITTDGLDMPKVDNLQLSGDARYELDSLTGLRGTADLTVSRDDPDDPLVSEEPWEVSGDASLSASRRLGHFTATLTGSVGRSVYGDTTLADSSEQSNEDQNNSRYGGALRVGFDVTPILTPFVEGSADYQAYDAPSPVFLERLDAADYALRGGLAAKWGTLLEAEGSIGVGLRQFTYDVADGLVTTLYDARLIYRPASTTSVTASFTTTVGAPGPDSAGAARVEYAAGLEASYLVNPWLRLRGAAGWSSAELVGTAETEHSWNAGVGADYLVSAHTSLTADYSRTVTDNATDPDEDEHRVTLGVTFSN